MTAPAWAESLAYITGLSFGNTVVNWTRQSQERKGQEPTVLVPMAYGIPSGLLAAMLVYQAFKVYGYYKPSFHDLFSHPKT